MAMRERVPAWYLSSSTGRRNAELLSVLDGLFANDLMGLMETQAQIVTQAHDDDVEEEYVACI